MNARREADRIVKDAAEQKRLIAEKAQKDGYSEGVKKGFDDGYRQGYGKCAEALDELKKINAQLLSEKSQLMQTYERQLFDMIFAVAQKITVDSLKQKDKAVIEKMLRQAAKSFRGAKTVKVTLSALDFSENMDADLANLKHIFEQGTYVEFDVQKDAENGTLILDNGSEIIDASVSTQLRMIEELGRGKYRDKKSILEYEPMEELEEEAPPETEAEKSFAEVFSAVSEDKKPETPTVTEKKEAAQAEESKSSQPQEESIPTVDKKTDSAPQGAQPDKKEAAPKSAEKKAAPKKSRKPTNPLLTKMMDNLGESKT